MQPQKLEKKRRMGVLGEDGGGYELARKLETVGAWREWLGDDSLYSTFLHSLSSPSTWDSFLHSSSSSSSSSSSKSHLLLQLRVRALLFDKASISLFSSPLSLSLSNLNPSYLQLHGDDVYFTFEDGGDQHPDNHNNDNNIVGNSKSGYGIGSRYGDREMERFRNEELPDTWYNQFIEKHRVNRPYRLSLGERESDKRSPGEMSSYLRIVDKIKRRRIAFIGDQTMGGYGSNSGTENSSGDDDSCFLPETMFMLNCVPDSALPPVIRDSENQKIEFRGVLDALPQSRSVMIERLGISVEQAGGSQRGRNGNKRVLSQEQALIICQKVVSRMLARLGFDAATEMPLEAFSQLLRCHISKLGRTIKILTDSYKKQCSAIELVKMFLHTAGYSNLASLMELVRDGTRNIVQPAQQQLHGMQPQLQSQHQNALQLQQQLQMPRQMHPQMQQMVHPQNLAFQQQHHLQLERMRRRQQQHQQQQQQLQQQQLQQQSTPRPGMDMDKDKPLLQVKLEHQSDMPIDGNALNIMHSRHPQMQFRPQQLATAMSNIHTQSLNQFRQMASSHVPQVQTPNMGIVRAPPVKVEGFSELMGGGDTTSKHDSEENKLTSPPSK